MTYPKHPIANPEAYSARCLFLFAFGAYGSTFVHVFMSSDDLSGALEVAAEWLVENAPGVFTPEADIREGYTTDELEAIDDNGEHYPDMTCTEAGWIPSYEWFASNYTPHDTAEPEESVRLRAMLSEFGSYDTDAEELLLRWALLCEYLGAERAYSYAMNAGNLEHELLIADLFEGPTRKVSTPDWFDESQMGDTFALLAHDTNETQTGVDRTWYIMDVSAWVHLLPS